MLLVKPSFKIIDEIDGVKILRSIEQAGRTCYKSEDKISEGSAGKFVAMIIKRGHESVLEHEKVSVRIVCDRGVSHELVRHRIASFSQESTRYCNYEGGVAFVIPPWTSISPGNYEKGSHTLLVQFACPADAEWFWMMEEVENSYQTLLDNGWTPEKARSVLPNSLKTEIVMTANLREWRHFFKLRASTAAHPQMQEIAYPLLKEMSRLIPVVFDDIVVV
jgi:thymidylate synthase (FAD)